MAEGMEKRVPRRLFGRTLGSMAMRGVLLGGGLFGFHELREDDILRSLPATPNSGATSVPKSRTYNKRIGAR